MEKVSLAKEPEENLKSQFPAFPLLECKAVSMLIVYIHDSETLERPVRRPWSDKYDMQVFGGLSFRKGPKLTPDLLDHIRANKSNIYREGNDGGPFVTAMRACAAHRNAAPTDIEQYINHTGRCGYVKAIKAILHRCPLAQTLNTSFKHRHMRPSRSTTSRLCVLSTWKRSVLVPYNPFHRTSGEIRAWRCAYSSG
jgi:hypothetical protein